MTGGMDWDAFLASFKSMGVGICSFFVLKAP